MTQAQLEHEIADATDESIFDVRQLALSCLSDEPADHDPGPLFLVIDCPHCRGAARYPGQRPDGSYPMARCPGCEAVFGFDVLDVYVAASPNG